jgi:hypothetical protein
MPISKQCTYVGTYITMSIKMLDSLWYAYFVRKTGMLFCQKDCATLRAVHLFTLATFTAIVKRNIRALAEWSSGNVFACRAKGREIESRQGIGCWVPSADWLSSPTFRSYRNKSCPVSFGYFYDRGKKIGILSA